MVFKQDNNMKKLLIIILLSGILLTSACGNKKSPTGGPVDNIKPEILNVTPNNFEQITDNTISITFSKPIDKTSLIQGIQIYPPVENKKYSWNNNTLNIKINEPLKENTNYYLNIGSALKCFHGNNLEKPLTYIFINGKLNTNKISAQFAYEDEKDQFLEKRILLLDSDSLLVSEKNTAENNIIFDYLNNQSFLIRSYIDKNKNNRYDYGIEPYFQSRLIEKSLQPVKINLAYADTTKPSVKYIKSNSKNDIEIVFTKNIIKLPYVLIEDHNKQESVQIINKYLENNTLRLITADQDTTTYQVYLSNIIDKKLNTTNSLIVYMKGNPLPLKNVPKIVSSFPRNGQALKEQKPKIRIDFSEVMLNKNIKFSLIESETSKNIPASIISGDSKQIVISPNDYLKKFNTYILKIDKPTSNHHNVQLPDNFEIMFIITDEKK